MKKYKNILIIKTSALGDIVRTFPAVIYLRKTFPEAHISYLVAEQFAELIEPCPHINEIIRYKKRKNMEDLGGFIRFGLSLRERGFDLALNLQNTGRFDLLARLSGAKKRSPIVRLERPMDGIEGVFEILRAAGLSPTRKYRDFWFSPDDNLFAQHFLMDNELLGHHRVIGLNPGAGWPTKQWPVEHWAALADRLASVENTRFVVFGSGAELDRALEISSRSSQHIAIATGKTTIRQAARIIKECSAFISNDSGLMHIADMLDVPTIGLFGPTNPAYHGPTREGNVSVYKGVECAPCYKSECPLDLEKEFCIRSISVDEVLKSVKKIMR